MNKYKAILYNSIKPYSALLFLDSKVGGFILLAITFINPSVALSGLVAVIFTILFAKLIEIQELSLSHGFYIYNSLLVGMGIGYIFYPSLTSIALIAVSSVFTFMLSFMLNRLFGVYKIPILSLPFSIVTIFVYLASLKYSGLLSSLINNATLYDISLPLYISGFLKSFGTIFFLPNNIAGILIFGLILYFSRVIAIMALSGFYFGVFIHSFFISSLTQAMNNPYAFNYILVAIALGGIFLLPTIKNFLLAYIGVAISVVLTDSINMFFNYYAIPVFTLPFNLTVIVFIFILSITHYKGFNINIQSTPEKSLSVYLSKIFRFGEVYKKVSLPFTGEWTVYQAFDGEWTHKGEYRYAYDFVKVKNNKSYKGDGLYASDYYAFGESVLSPISGFVVDARDDLKDNIIGEVDRVNNWGNYIIIKSDLGFFVEISHLMQYSLVIKVGDYIQTGAIIAKCGNSGYSPQPHIHIQVQDVGVIGGFTSEFCFSEYYQNNKLLFNTIPKKDELVESVIEDKSISSRFLFILDDTLKYDVYKDKQKIKTVNFKVRMNSFSEFFFEDEDSNKLYFYNDLKQFYFYNYDGKESYLKNLFILAPRIPFINSKNISYEDYLPVNLLKNRFQTILIELLSSFNKEFYKTKMEYKFDKDTILSINGKVVIESHNKGFSTINYNSTQLRRVF